MIIFETNSSNVDDVIEVTEFRVLETFHPYYFSEYEEYSKIVRYMKLSNNYV